MEKQIPFFMAAAIILAAALVYIAHLEKECTAQQGVLVRGIWGPECIEPRGPSYVPR